MEKRTPHGVRPDLRHPALTRFAKIATVKPSHLVIGLLLGAIALSVTAHLQSTTYLLCLFLDAGHEDSYNCQRSQRRDQSLAER